MVDRGWPRAHVTGTTTEAGRLDGARRPIPRRSVLAGGASGPGTAATCGWRDPCQAEAARPATPEAWWQRLLPGAIGSSRTGGSDRFDPAPRRWTEADLDQLLLVEDTDVEASTAPNPAKTVTKRGD